jgi:cobalt-zinc-cadmium efflux system protein
MTEHHHGSNDHHSHSAARAASARALWAALTILGIFFAVEIVGGILANSLALLSDAAHLLTDVAAIGLALFAQWFASRPPSARRSYGYRRMEIIAALFNGLTLWVVAVFIIIEAAERALEPPPVEGGLMLLVAGLGFAAQAGAAFILMKASSESLNVRGAYIHALTDAVQSIGVMIAALVIMFTDFLLIDPIVSILIALLIVWSGGKIVLEAVHILLEGTPHDLDLEHLARSMCQTPGVRQITDLHAWSLTTGFNALSAHVVGAPELDARDREALTESLGQKLKREFPVHHVTLQVERSCGMDGSNSCCVWLKNNGDPPSRTSDKSD